MQQRACRAGGCEYLAGWCSWGREAPVPGLAPTCVSGHTLDFRTALGPSSRIPAYSPFTQHELDTKRGEGSGSSRAGGGGQALLPLLHSYSYCGGQCPHWATHPHQRRVKCVGRVFAFVSEVCQWSGGQGSWRHEKSAAEGENWTGPCAAELGGLVRMGRLSRSAGYSSSFSRTLWLHHTLITLYVRICLSIEALAMKLPSGEAATAMTSSVWPVRVLKHSLHKRKASTTGSQGGIVHCEPGHQHRPTRHQICSPASPNKQREEGET